MEMKYTEKDKYVHVGLLATSFACLLVLLEQDSASTAQLIGLVCFAFSVPALAVCVSALFIQQIDKREALSRIPFPYRILGIVAAIVGIDASFWHFGAIPGIAFLVSLFLATKMLERVPWIHETITFDKDDI